MKKVSLKKGLKISGDIYINGERFHEPQDYKSEPDLTITAYARLDTLAMVLYEQGTNAVSTIQRIIEAADITINDLLMFEDEFCFIIFNEAGLVRLNQEGNYVWSWELDN